MSRCFVSFVVKLWSTDPDKWPFSPTKLHGAIPIFKNRDCAFLFARIIYKEDSSTMSMNHRYFFILDTTVWYWHFHAVWLKLSTSLLSFISKINLPVPRMWLANPHSILPGGFFLSRAKAFLLHQHSWWLSLAQAIQRKKRSRRYSLRLRFDPFSKLRHHSTPYCCLNKSATMFCFWGIGRPDEARLAAYSAQSSATRASICASLVWFNAPRRDTTVS